MKNARSMESELTEAWGRFLADYPWDWFLTLTFRDPPGTFRAHRMFARFARDIEKAANVRIGWFRADEYGSAAGHLHLHALMLNTGHLSRIAWMQEWDRRAGFARILPFDPTRGAAFYCSKYIAKQLGEYDFSENLDAFKGPRPAVQPSLFLTTSEPDNLIRNSGSPQLSAPSKPHFRNTAEDPLIANLDGKASDEPKDPQLDLIPEDGEDN